MGLTIPRLGFGTWQAAPGQTKEAVSVALHTGVRHVDAAFIYGNESEVGQAIAESKVPREQLWVTTKLWNSFHEDVRTACELSRMALGLDYLDAYLVHFPVKFKKVVKNGKILPVPKENKKVLTEPLQLMSLWRQMESLVDEGLVRHIGVCNFTVEQMEELLSISRIPPAINQIELHPYLPQHELVRFCKSRGVHVTAYSPLGSTDSPILKHPLIEAVAKQHNATPAQVLISWGLARGTSVLFKSVTPARIRSNCQQVALSKDDIQKINSITERLRVVHPGWGAELFQSQAKL